MERPARRFRRFVFGTSGLLALEMVVGAVVRYVLDLSTMTSVFGLSGVFFIGVITSAPFVVVLAYAPVWLERRDVDAERYPRILKWCLGGAAVFLLINVPIMPLFPTSIPDYVSWVRWAVAIGAGVGVWIGVVEAQAVDRALELQREQIRNEQLETQRDLFDYLNSLLRHEVLNSANTVEGYASLLQEDHDPGTDVYEYAEIISRQAEDLETIIDDTRSLLNVLKGTAELEPVDLGAVVSEVASSTETSRSDVEIDVQIPEGTTVYGDPLLRRLFENLVRNAADHNDDGLARVCIDAEPGEDTVVVTVTDDGPGIPDELRGTLFSRPEKSQVNHGFGLYLGGKLAEYYGGDVELAETGGDGTVFRIELPSAEGDESSVSPSPASAFSARERVPRTETAGSESSSR